MDWLVLALVCAFSLATADALTKRWLAGYSSRQITAVRFGWAGLLLVPLLAVEPLPQVPLQFWAWIAGLVPLEVLAMLLYTLAIRDSPLSLTLPYLAFTPVITAGFGYAFLGESVSIQGLAGILLVVAGAWLLNVDASRGGGRWAWLAPFPAILRERGARLMLAVAGIYGLTSVGGKAAMAYATPESFGAFYFVLLGAVSPLLLVSRGRGELATLVRRPWIHLAIGACMAIMVVTHFLAIARVEAAYMIAVKRTSLLFGILYGALMFGERHLGRDLAAGGLMVAGVALIGLG